MSRKRGFTLIELLVVIAIIGILASMVFPVFARARESARKAVCLSNVKNIGLAIQMYLADNNDTLPPWETRQEALDYVASVPGGGGGCDPGANTGQNWVRERATRFNPYLRWPVIMDEYIKNRDVWKCPSAKMECKADIIVPVPDFLSYWQSTEGSWGQAAGGWTGPCNFAWPSGWGGDVTDYVMQGGAIGETNTFTFAIDINRHVAGLKLASVNDPVQFAISGDSGTPGTYNGIGRIAYPDICCAECADVMPKSTGWPSVDCPDGSGCADCPPTHATVRQTQEGNDDWKADAARHLGGVNVGFLDGHAQWILSQRLVNMYEQGDIEGISQFCWVSDAEHYRQECGDPGGIEFLLSNGQGDYM